MEEVVGGVAEEVVVDGVVDLEGEEEAGVVLEEVEVAFKVVVVVEVMAVVMVAAVMVEVVEVAMEAGVVVVVITKVDTVVALVLSQDMVVVMGSKVVVLLQVTINLRINIMVVVIPVNRIQLTVLKEVTVLHNKQHHQQLEQCNRMVVKAMDNSHPHPAAMGQLQQHMVVNLMVVQQHPATELKEDTAANLLLVDRVTINRHILKAVATQRVLNLTEVLLAEVIPQVVVMEMHDQESNYLGEYRFNFIWE